MSDITSIATNTSVTCPLCSSDEHQTLATRGRAGEDLHTVVCTGCGLVFISPIPTAEEVAEYYAKEYRLKYKGVVQPKRKHIYRAGKRALLRLPLIEEFAKPGQRVLDIGSGGGEFVYLLKSKGFAASGIEPDEGYGGFSIQEYGIDVKIGPFDETMFEPDSFDVVTANHVVEHLRDPLTVFQGIWKGLKKGGHLIVEVPNVESKYHTPCNRWHFAHIFNFNTDTMENLGRRAGFEVVRTDLVSKSVHVRTVFKKTENAKPMQVSHENYHRVKNTLDSYTNYDHYTSTMPARRLWSSVAQVVHEKIAVHASLSGKEILDRIYTAESSNSMLARSA
ncbi:class I SAM-dependent methyltransferase [Thalassoglobus sp.]|uniref:class I SAM-dependent methyltransferase n=1 Tax=Thalassoglobus sp. TaxID=2795869 RepID=UPI003AA902AB